VIYLELLTQERHERGLGDSAELVRGLAHGLVAQLLHEPGHSLVARLPHLYGKIALDFTLFGGKQCSGSEIINFSSPAQRNM